MRDGLIAADGEAGRPRTGLTIVSVVLDAHGGDIEWHRADDHVAARVTLPAVPREDRTAGTATVEADRSDRVYCLEIGRVTAEGEPDEVRNDAQVVASYLGTDQRTIERSGPVTST